MPATVTLPFAIRDGREGDQAFILDSWWRSWRDRETGDPTQAWVPWEAWWSVAKPHMLATIARGVVLVATPHGMDESVAGWAIGERDGVLHYAVTKRTFRRGGVARALVVELSKRIDTVRIATHWTVAGSKLSVAMGMVYDPTRGGFAAGDKR